jgi:hypothetical protein
MSQKEYKLSLAEEQKTLLQALTELESEGFFEEVKRKYGVKPPQVSSSKQVDQIASGRLGDMGRKKYQR